MENLTKQEIASLAKEARDGDRDAFSRLYQHTFSAQFFTALSLLKDRSLAEEAVQNAYLYALDKIRNLKTPEAFLTWLNQITYHHCINLLKRTSRDKSQLEAGEPFIEDFSQPENHQTPLEQVLEDEKRNQVLRFISGLSLEHRAVILMRYYQNRKLKDIAAIMGCSEGTVKSRLHYAHRQLRREMQNRGIRGSESFLGTAPLISAALLNAARVSGFTSSPGKKVPNLRLFPGRLAVCGLILTAFSAYQVPKPAQIYSNTGDASVPVVSRYDYRGDKLTVYLVDYESDIDYRTLGAQTARGVPLSMLSQNTRTGRVTYSCPDKQEIILTVSDRNGNTGEYLISLDEKLSVPMDLPQ